MLELERLLAADRRARLAHDEIAQDELLERSVDVVDLRGEMLERAAHEEPAHRGCTLDQRALRRRQAVDARCDERLERVGDALGACTRALREHPDHLLDEERVALGLREHGRRVDRQLERPGQRRHELGALQRLQRLELDRRRAHAAAAPARPDVEQLAAREAEQHERRLADGGGEMLDQLEQRLLAPVDVLEHEHERLRLRELLRPRARGPRDLLLAALALDGLEHADGEPEQIGDRLVLAALAQLSLRGLERIVVGDAGGRLHHLGERPVRDALAVGQAAAEQHRRALETGDELAREAALPDAWIAVEREQRRAAVADGAREGVLEQLELALAPDERRREAADRLLRPPRRRPTRCAATGFCQPRRSSGPTGSSSMRPRRRLAAPGPTRISPGPASCWSLAARLTASPVANVDVGVALGDDLAGLDPDPRREAELADPLERRESRHGRRALHRPRARAARRRPPSRRRRRTSRRCRRA